MIDSQVYENEMLHAAMNILENRAEQLDMEPDELMHYSAAYKQAVADSRYKKSQREKEKKEKELNKKKDALLKSARKAHDKEETKGFGNLKNKIFNNDYYTTQNIERYDPELARTLAEGHEVYVGKKYDPKAERKNTEKAFDTTSEKEFDPTVYTKKPGGAIKPKAYGYDAYDFIGEKEVKQERKDRREAEKQARIEKKKKEKEAQEAFKKSPEYQEQLRQEDLNRKKEELLKKARQERYKRENGDRYIP